MHEYRTHNCGALCSSDVDHIVKLSGWIHKKRDHGSSLLFIDLRDFYGITQLVFNVKTEHDQNLIELASSLRLESVVSVKGLVRLRADDTINPKISTGMIEVIVDELFVHSESEPLPIPVADDNTNYPENLRLQYRFLDLRRKSVRDYIILRNQVIRYMREYMYKEGFMEFQTPILTASSPEGARDYLVPSRLDIGKFYALPQSPQLFKQIIMISGFDRYFQIAPCFRNEDARSDRSPGEFYQLDIEMSFVTEDDIFNFVEPFIYSVFSKFSKKIINKPPFLRLTYNEAIDQYGCDKPDLRNPIIIKDVTDIFIDSEFAIFRNNIKNGYFVKALKVSNIGDKPRSFFDKLISDAKDLGASGMAYIVTGSDSKGPIAKFLDKSKEQKLRNLLEYNDGDIVFFVSEKQKMYHICGKIRDLLGCRFELINENEFYFCWITDFPFYEWNDELNKIEFMHNPFSMPKSNDIDLLKIESDDYQSALKLLSCSYDIVCNGIELSSGAIRNNRLDILYKAFSVLGYSDLYVKKNFGSMVKALSYGAPPHGGLAPGIDRIVMLLAEVENIREIICFPLNQHGCDLLMNAPTEIDDKCLRELGLKFC
jgi:aspartyl-tRNA synthetase